VARTRSCTCRTKRETEDAVDDEEDETDQLRITRIKWHADTHQWTTKKDDDDDKNDDHSIIKMLKTMRPIVNNVTTPDVDNRVSAGQPSRFNGSR
jgi:uncharacterized Zn finger protein (UPF0148 family)